MRLKVRGGVVCTELSALWPPGHMGTNCCLKCPGLADPSPQDVPPQPAGRRLLCRRFSQRPSTTPQKWSKTPITSKDLVVFPQQDKHQPSPQETHQQRCS